MPFSARKALMPSRKKMGGAVGHYQIAAQIALSLRFDGSAYARVHLLDTGGIGLADQSQIHRHVLRP
jgi:hypothetical protein